MHSYLLLFLALTIAYSCKQTKHGTPPTKPFPQTLFARIPFTFIKFSNRIHANEYVTLLNSKYIYNSGRVAVGDYFACRDARHLTTIRLSNGWAVVVANNHDKPELFRYQARQSLNPTL